MKACPPSSGRHPDLLRYERWVLARSAPWLKSGIQTAQFEPMVRGGAVGPARAGLSRLTGLAKNLVTPVGARSCRQLRVAAPGQLCPGCGAGLALFPVRRLAGTRFRPGLLFGP